MKKSQKFLTISLFAAVVAVIALTLAGCAQEPEPAKAPPKEAAPPAEKPAEAPAAEPEKKPEETKAKPAPSKKALLNPSALKEKAPETFKVKWVTSKGDVIIDVTRAWAPKGADRFYNLVKNGFYDGCKFFRIVPNFIVQVGMSPDPRVSRAWQPATIKDDPVTKTNRKGTITFAKTSYPNSRTTQLFINLKANAFLDGQGFAPFGTVTEGMDVIESLYAGYGEAPDQELIRNQGNKYLESKFPKLDYIQAATIIEE